MKVLIIGIDGATWDVIDGEILDHWMPNFKKLRTSGTSGALESTLPAITPAAWTSATSGCSPHIHGLLDFQYYSFKDNIIRPTNASRSNVPSMWQYFGQAGYKVASINVPFTYPPQKVNGYMVSGLGCPGTSCEFTYPPEFKKEVLQQIPDYGLMFGAEELDRRKTRKKKEVFSHALEKMTRRFEQRVELAEFIHEKHPVDIMMVEFQQVDLLQHLVWAYVSPKTRDQFSWHRDRVFEFFAKLDECIGRILKLIDPASGLIVALSDHGFGSMDYTVNPNKMLRQWGYIKRSNIWGRMVRRIRINLMKETGSRREKSISLKLPVNWSKTKAIVLLRPAYGSLFVNVKGRQPGGCVAPGAEYENLLDELKQRFEQAENPHNGEKIFQRVVRPQDIWGDVTSQQEKIGDLILIQKKNYRLSLSLKQNDEIVQPNSITGHNASWHRSNGIYILAGKNIRQNQKANAQIIDLAPTIYSWLNMKIPAEVNGRTIEDAFQEKLTVQKNSQQSFPEDFDKSVDISNENEEEREQLTQQLKNLGYLD